MYRTYLPAVLIALAVLAVPSAPSQETLSRKEWNSIVQAAHTEEQYARLEKHYKEQEERFREMEQAEKQQMDRSASSGVYSKYPSAYERSRNLWLYYTSQREQATALAKLYGAKKDASRREAGAAAAEHP